MTAEEQLKRIREILGVQSWEDPITFLENLRDSFGLSNWESLRDLRSNLEERLELDDLW